MAEQELLIEEAQLQDAEKLAKLLAAVQTESDFLIRDSSFSAFTAEQLQDFITSNLKNHSQICLLAKIGESLVGIANVATAEFERINHIGEVFIAVRKAYWGYGIGSFLMEAVDDWALHTPQLKRLELTVQARNKRAVKLYEKMGYLTEGTKKRGAKTENGEFLDVYLMAKLLN